MQATRWPFRPFSPSSCWRISMRKWFYAGAVVGGFLLLGAAPAQADVVPAPAGGLLGSLGGGATQGLGLDPAGGLNLASPLDGSSLMDVKPGQNSADLT